MVATSPLLSPTAFVTAPVWLPHAAVRLSLKPDRRQSEDRRLKPRGGRRATDAQVAVRAIAIHERSLES